MQPGYSGTALWSNSDTIQQHQQQIFYCYPNNSFAAPSISPVDSGTVLINDPSHLGYFLQPSAAAAGGLLPNSTRYSLISAPTLPFQQYAVGPTQTHQQPVAIPTDQVFITGTKVTRTFDEVLSNPQVCSSRVIMTSHDTDINAEPPNAANDAKKAKLEPDVTCCKPSRVIHFRGIPNDASEGEIVQLGIPFGHMTNMVVAKKKNQALLEMNDVSSAQALVSFYSERPPQIRGRTVYVQFSNHDQLKTEDSLQTACAQAALETAQTMATNGECQKSVLRVIIENLLYPVTLDMLKQIFAKYGQVVKIVTFNKNNAFQALIQYSDPVSAQMAKMSLDGHSIYPGCCVLRIDFSKLPSLNVRYNNDKSRDFLDSTLPSGDLPITFNAGTLAYSPTSGGVLAPTYATAAVIPGIGPTIAYCTTSPTTGALSYGTHGLLPASFQVPAGMRLQWHQQQISPLNAVLLVTNLCEEKVTPDALFILFGVYGDVIRVKIMFNKKDNALVQFSDGNQAQLALMHLDNVKLWGREIKVAPSKHNIVQMPKEGQPDSGLTKDFTNSPLHRFKKPHSKNYNNIYPPSSTLHLSNIPPITTKEFILDLFSPYGTIVAFKFFETDHKMALMQMSSKEEAMEALIELHNHQLAETTHLRVSFSKSTISPSQDMPENQETIEG